MEGTESIFTKIIKREIPADIVAENERLIAFRDINPQAPVHILVVPKKPLRNLKDAKEEDKELLGEMLLFAAELARKEGIDEQGYRVVINNEESAGQSVFHLHFHLLGGRTFSWPPG
ncbi:MAG: histidine triad nucleotide-binding protein [Candidatus Dadabacteria bacterium]|nr:MAG: histidine triad nucleotide-binding protein [Candidatus Dadabacteria bacterium]